MPANDSGGEDQKPGLMARIQQFLEADRKKWGGMSLGAHLRLGMAELREVFSFGGNVVQSTPYGMFGTVTPGEVAASRQPDRTVWNLEQEPKMAGGSLRSPSQIGDQTDESSLSSDEQQKLFAEWRADYAARREESINPTPGLPSPGEIAQDQEPHKPEPEPGRETGQEHGNRGM